MFDYRSLLKAHYEKHLAEDSKHNRNSFALKLRIMPSKVVPLLNGNRGIAAMEARRLASVLSLSPSDYALFCASAEYYQTQNARRREQLRAQLETASSCILSTPL